MTDTSAHRRTPYESEERLQDNARKRQMSDILGLDDEKLTNSDPLVPPKMVGAGRVKRFRDEREQSSSVASESDRDGIRREADIEMGGNSSIDVHHHHPRGYPSLAKFIGSDKDFFVFRRFSDLSARNLLYLQDELVDLEARLQRIDLTESLNGSAQNLWNLHSRREDANQLRQTIMKEIKEKLQEYQSAVQSQAFMLSLEQAPHIHVDSIANWVDGIKPTVEAESHFLENRGDLISIAGGHTSKELLERYLERNWHRLFLEKRKEHHSTSSMVEYYSTGSIKHAARALLAVIAAVFAVLPIPLLTYFSSGTIKILVISVFAVVFAAMFSIMTNGRTPEIFAAMAAYAAFLAVFITSSPVTT